MPKRLVLVAVFLFLVIGLAGRSVEASQMAVVTNPTVNLRGGAGTNHPVVGQAGQGARLPVLGKSGDWVQVRQANGQAAWVAGWLVRLEAAPASVAPTQPATATGGQVAVVTTGAVNLRGGAGTNHPVVGQAGQGACLPVLGKSGDWVQVRQANGQAAWVAGWLVRLEAAPASVAPTQPATATGGQVAVVTTGAVNLRGGAGTNHPVVGQAGQGARLPVLGKSGDWVQVRQANGQAAWVAGWLVRLEAAPASVAPTQPATATGGQVAVVTTGAVNLRGGAGTNHPVVGQAGQGARLPVLGKSGDWVQVRQANGQAAWVAGWLVRLEAAPASVAPTQPTPVTAPGSVNPTDPPDRTVRALVGNAVVDVEAVDVRSQPGRQYTAIAQATRGFRLPLVAERGGWYQIRLPNGNLGWVESATVRVDIDTAGLPPVNGGSDADPDRGEISFDARVSGDRVIITVSSTTPIEYSAFRLPNPDRIVIDVDGFAGGQVPATQTLQSPVVSTIRTGEADGRFRLACDVKQGLAHTRYKTDLSGDRRTLTVEIFAVANVMQGRVIVLDAGHGGRDPGATGPTGVREKDVVLAITLEAAQLLRQQGAEVILTRQSDVFVELLQRAEIANQAGADVFVSIHANANVDHSKHGTSTYWWPYPDVMTPGQIAARERLAGALQTALLAGLGRNDLGLFQARFAVLRATNMPSALVEVAFISNPVEERLLADPAFQNRAAAAIAAGLQDYFQEY
ncbi:SH3 domain-containing protein [Candidatus Desulforudis audaxviator]|nr:SH3 domain-containing protein [Candidatus Desulforudis audaxviator]